MALAKMIIAMGSRMNFSLRWRRAAHNLAKTVKIAIQLHLLSIHFSLSFSLYFSSLFRDYSGLDQELDLIESLPNYMNQS